MRLLVLSDIHGSWEVTYLVGELEGLKGFDAVVMAGDITNFGPSDFAQELIESISKPVLAVPGNCDPPDVLKAIERGGGINLHLRTHDFQGTKFAGVGGTNGKGFTMGITFTEGEAYSFLRRCKGCIFVTHQPPYGIMDRVGGRHIGSKGIREAVMEAKPRVVLFGHVHEARGYEITEDILFLNPGPAKMGYAAIVDTESLEVEMLEH